MSGGGIEFGASRSKSVENGSGKSEGRGPGAFGAGLEGGECMNADWKLIAEVCTPSASGQDTER